MDPSASFLDMLQLAADRAATAETAFRYEAGERIKALECERAFAYRRLNLMRALTEVVGGAENEELGIANAIAMLRAKLGWTDDSEARAAVLARFVPVAQALVAKLMHAEDKAAPSPDVIAELAAFEAWYAETHQVAFWILFESYMPETPVVDF